MKKVYCENCKYGQGYLECRAMPRKINPYTLEVEKKWWKSDFNEKGDCPYYKRKWYKFWIKN